MYCDAERLKQILTVLGLRKLELVTHLTRYLALANAQGITLGQDSRG